MRQLLVVECHIAVQRGFQFLAGAEMVRLQHLLDAAVEALDPLPGRRLQAIAERDAVRLRMLRRGQAVFDAEVGAELIERVLAGGAARRRRPNRRSVNSLPLSVRTVRMRIGQARSRSRRNRRALAAVFDL